MSYNRKIVCEYCDKTFLQTRKNQRFCSKRCAGDYRHKNASDGSKPYALARRVGEWKICSVCGSRYWNLFSRPKQFCSRKCLGVSMLGRNNIKFKPKAKVNCLYCSKEVEVWPCHATRKHFCSKDCQYKWRSENTRGDKVHNWMGGKGFGKYCSKFNYPFKERVRIFFKRKCFICGCDEVKERHHVHHINFNPEACCDNSQREFIILCRSCHANTTNSGDRKETARWYSKQLYEATGGKCYYTKDEIETLEEIIENLDKMSRWDLSHLML
jgi:hypothetical protein